MKITELHALIRQEIFRMVESEDLETPPLKEKSSFETMPGAPSVEQVKSADEQAKKYVLLWYRLVKVCQTKYGADSATWPPNAIKACQLLGAKINPVV